MSQRWDQLAYFHWPYPVAEVARLLPAGLDPDTFDGTAWVGLIPFEMKRIRLGPTPPIPHFGSFIEINVRTYVIDPRGRRAIYFFSLDVPLISVTAAARSIFSVPYCWAHTKHHIDGPRHTYTFERRWPKDDASASISFAVGSEVSAPTDFDHWMSARWALVASRRGGLEYGRVHHPPWPLYEVSDVEIDQSAIQVAGLSAPVGSPTGRYSPGVPVKLTWPQKITLDGQ